MKNKMLAMALAAMLALGAVACGGNDGEDAVEDPGLEEPTEAVS